MYATKLTKEIYFLSLNRKTKTSKCSKNSSNTLAAAVIHLALPCVSHFDVICDLLRTDTLQHGVITCCQATQRKVAM